MRNVSNLEKLGLILQEMQGLGPSPDELEHIRADNLLIEALRSSSAKVFLPVVEEIIKAYDSIAKWHA